MKVSHKTVYLDSKKTAVEIPFIPAMQEICPDKSFPLLDDPQKTKSTLMIGMFVLRAAYDEWVDPIIREDGSFSIYDVNKWIYNINTISGGGVIAHGNYMDGFRLGLQYGISDAVIVGSNTIATDGVPRPDGSRGYLWMPYECADWPHLKETVPQMSDLIREQRMAFQQRGFASDRAYPAQIAVSRSGRCHGGELLSASMFHEKHPDGTSIEAYILTSTNGAVRLRKRAADLGMDKRIDDILIVHSEAKSPDEIDLKSLPEMLYRDYDIRIANHDGGAMVLQSFVKAGIVSQFNFTFCRKSSLKEAVKTSFLIPENDREKVLREFDTIVQPLFSNAEGKLPRDIEIAQIIQDDVDEAVIAVLDTRSIGKF